MQDQREKDARLFLDVIYGDAPQDAVTTLSFVSRSTSASWQSTAYHIRDREQIIRDALQAKTQVYLRIPPMAHKPKTGRGLESESLGSQVLWCDLDCYGAQDEGQKQLEALPKPPTVIVNSGYGLQAYWKLTRFHEGTLSIKSRNKALSQLLNGGSGKERADSVYDLARVMRMPGSFNLKQQFPALVSIVAYNPDRVYELEQFDEADLQSVPEITNWEEEPLPDDFLDQVKAKDKKLADRILEEGKALKSGAPTRKSDNDKVDRSRNDQHVAIRLISLGYSPGIVMSVLTHNSFFSGSRWREKRSYDYVVSTVAKAAQQVGESPDRYFNGKSFVPSALAGELLKAQPLMYVAEKLYRYERGVYVPEGTEWVSTEVINKLGDRWQPKFSDATLRWLTDMTHKGLGEVNQFKGMVNVKNGMLDVHTLELKPHSPQYASLAQLPLVYDPDADCSRIDKFVADILPADAIPLFWEFIGSSLDTTIYWPKAMVALIGPADSGKSKLLEWVSYLIGEVNCAHLSFKTLAENKFATYTLFGKMMNIFADLEESEARDTGQLKALTGDDIISGEQKFKPVVSFKNNARLLFSANHHIQVKSPDAAFFRRVYIIPCSNHFTDETADRNIVHKLSTQNDFSAGFKRMLEGYQRLLTQNGFTPSESVLNQRKDYMASADTVTGFILSKTTTAPTEVITIESWYQEYQAWCKLGNRPPFSDQKFYRRMNEGLKEFGLERRFVDVGSGRQQWCYQGRKLLLDTEEVENGFILN